jgi:hypothetical protein
MGHEKGVLFLKGIFSLKNWSYCSLLRDSTIPFKSTCLLIKLFYVPGALYFRYRHWQLPSLLIIGPELFETPGVKKTAHPTLIFVQNLVRHSYPRLKVEKSSILKKKERLNAWKILPNIESWFKPTSQNRNKYI